MSRADFSRVYREGRRFAGEALAVYVRPTDGGRRVGVTAGRGLGRAVARNRAKRRLREAYRRIETRLRATGDIVLVARSGAIDAGFGEIMREMEALCAAGRLLCGET
ncbi:MAG TPA: ribonuclease P protein component [bacterium]|nr:ribonuclease P protein component [bacterium]